MRKLMFGCAFACVAGLTVSAIGQQPALMSASARVVRGKLEVNATEILGSGIGGPTKLSADADAEFLIRGPDGTPLGYEHTRFIVPVIMYVMPSVNNRTLATYGALGPVWPPVPVSGATATLVSVTYSSIRVEDGTTHNIAHAPTLSWARK